LHSSYLSHLDHTGSNQPPSTTTSKQLSHPIPLTQFTTPPQEKSQSLKTRETKKLSKPQGTVNLPSKSLCHACHTYAFPTLFGNRKKEGYRDCIAAPKKRKPNGRAHGYRKGCLWLLGLGQGIKMYVMQLLCTVLPHMRSAEGTLNALEVFRR
jgi:hypothetical protein